MTLLQQAPLSPRFPVSLDPREIFFSAALDRVCTKLLATLREPKGLTFVLGEEGIGKTTLLGKLRWYLRPDEIPIIAATATTSIDNILGACGSASKRPATRTDRAAAVQAILIDAGEQLTPATLLELHKLQERRANGRRLFAIVVAGRPSLGALLASPQLAPLRRTQFETIALPALAGETVGAFIAHRLRSPNGLPDIAFEPAAIELLAVCSRGVPRLIDLLSRFALAAASLDGVATVTRQHVQRAIAECPAASLAVSPTDATPPDAAPPEVSDRWAALLSTARQNRGAGPLLAPRHAAAAVAIVATLSGVVYFASRERGPATLTAEPAATSDGKAVDRASVAMPPLPAAAQSEPIEVVSAGTSGPGAVELTPAGASAEASAIASPDGASGAAVEAMTTSESTAPALAEIVPASGDAVADAASPVGDATETAPTASEPVPETTLPVAAAPASEAAVSSSVASTAEAPMPADEPSAAASPAKELIVEATASAAALPTAPLGETGAATTPDPPPASAPPEKATVVAALPRAPAPVPAAPSPSAGAAPAPGVATPADPPPASAPPEKATVVAALPSALAPAPAAPSPASPSAGAAPAPAPVPPTVVPPAVGGPAPAILLARGDALLRTGDIAAARLFYQRAAEQGEAPAAIALAKTYDPDVLKSLRIRGSTGDRVLAAHWYKRASELAGSRKTTP